MTLSKKAYMLQQVTVRNIEIFSEYMDKVPAVIENYQGAYVIRSSKVSSYRGEWNPERIVLIGFDSMDLLQACFSSAEYQALAPLLEQSSDSQSIIIEE